jgi:small-conductance mechanosensitive channel
MDDILPLDAARSLAERALLWLRGEAFSASGAAQWAAILLSFVLAAALARPSRRAIGALFQKVPHGAGLHRLENTLVPLAPALLWLLALWLLLQAAERMGPSPAFVRGAASLLGAWIAIRLAAGLLRDAALARAVAAVAWTVAALGLLGLLRPAIEFLDSLAIGLGAFRLSVWLVVKTLLTLALLLWIATVAARVLNARIARMPQFTPSVRVLLAKAVSIGFVVAAIVVALTATCVDLTVFAVVGGAIGLGIGFGLQKIVSNLVSGVILLLDRSIKPGDVIEIGDTYGWITFLGARYVAVQTRDRKEWLIPNEDLITNRVVNWSRSDDLLRLHAPFGVAYGTDLKQAVAVAVAAARATERVVADPAPVCLVTAFADSAVELDLRFWIRDPQNGTANVRSAVFLALWEALRENGIVIPFPQRDVWIRNPEAAT